jgi:MSHA biogenesis protein MshI
MARQINLINPALRKTRDGLSALPLAVVAAVLIVLVAAAAVAAHVAASRRHGEAEALVASQKQAQEALLAATQQQAARKPDPRLAAELEGARMLVKRQQEILVRLDSGTIGNTQGFSEYLRGFARQVPQGLWLTGFTIGAGGSDMEVRGRMVSPALLTEYVRRLNTESAFRGHSFAGLLIQGSRAEATASGTPAAPAYTEFVLSSTPPGAGQ